MPSLKPQSPARKLPESCKTNSRQVAHAGIDKIDKNMEIGADPGLILRKRLHAEMEALRGLVEKAEHLVGKNGNGSAPPNRFGRGRLLEAEVRRPVTTEERTRSAKRRTTPIAKIVEPVTMPRKNANAGAAPRHAKEERRSLETKARQESAEEESKVAFTKKRTLLAMDIVESRAPTRETVARCVSSPLAKMPTHIEKKDVANVSRKTMPVARIAEPMTMPRKNANAGAAPHRTKEERCSFETKARQESTEEEPKVAFTKKRKTLPAMDIVESRAPKRETVARCVSSSSAKAPAHIERKDVANVSRKIMPVARIAEPMMMPRKNANAGAAPRRPKEGRRSIETKAQPESTEEEPKVAFTKKRKTMPPVEIAESRTPKRETVARCVSSLSAKTPTHIEKKDVANVSRSLISRPSPHELEEGEIVVEEENFVDICSSVSPVPTVRPSSPILLEAGKTEEEENVLVDISGDASPMVAKKLAEAENSPSSSSSGRSSGSSCSDSSDSESSGSSGSSSSYSSDSDSEDESVGSSPAPDYPRKVDTPLVVPAHEVVRTSPCVREAEEIEEGECGGASPVAAEEFVATGNSPSSSSNSLSSFADDQSVGSSPFPSFLPFPNGDEQPKKPVEQRQTAAPPEKSAAPAPEMSSLLARARVKMRQLRREPERQKAYDELEAMEKNTLPSNWIPPADMIEFGITAVEHLVTIDRLVPGCGGPVQQRFGLSWKGE